MSCSFLPLFPLFCTLSFVFCWLFVMIFSDLLLTFPCMYSIDIVFVVITAITQNILKLWQSILNWNKLTSIAYKNYSFTSVFYPTFCYWWHKLPLLMLCIHSHRFIVSSYAVVFLKYYTRFKSDLCTWITALQESIFAYIFFTREFFLFSFSLIILSC